MADGSQTEETPSRPRLVLKPRDEAAAKKIEAERQASSGKVLKLIVIRCCRPRVPFESNPHGFLSYLFSTYAESFW